MYSISLSTVLLNPWGTLLHPACRQDLGITPASQAGNRCEMRVTKVAVCRQAGRQPGTVVLTKSNNCQLQNEPLSLERIFKRGTA